MSDDDSQFLPAAALDPNAWYHLTEQGVDDFVEDAKDFTKILLAKDSSGDLAINDNDGKTKQYWQFQPVDEGSYKARYAIRADVDEVKTQLGVCRVDEETSDSKTRPCMLDSDGSDTQKWDIDRWNGTQTYRFINVANGTKYWMDCSKDNTPFMNHDIDLSTRQPGQHWYMSSISAVDDEQYSTIFGSPSSSSSSSSSEPTGGTGGSGPPSGHNEELSTGAKAGIGIGAALAVIAIAVLAAIFFGRRYRCHKQHKGLPLPSQLSSPASTVGVPAYSRIGESKDFQSDAATYDSAQRSQTAGAYTMGAQTLGGQTMGSHWEDGALTTGQQQTISELAGDYQNQPHELHGDHGHSRV